MNAVRFAGLRLKTLISLMVPALPLSSPSLPAQFAFTTPAGAAAQAGAVDSAGSGARFHEPAGIVVASDGALYLADAANHAIRKIARTGTTWTVTTVAGALGLAGAADGTNVNARFYYPYGVALGGGGELYVADTYNHTVRKVAPAGTNWVVTTLAGAAGASGSSDGSGSAAKFNFPYGLAATQDGIIYVADSYNHTIRRVTPAGEVTSIAGVAGGTGIADGTNASARFNYPSGIALDAAGNLVVADTYNSIVRRISRLGNDWITATLAGLPRFSGSADGTNRAAQFNYPFGIASGPGGVLYVADTVNSTLRTVTPVGTDWVVNTIAGAAGNPGASDGPSGSARFNLPYGLALDTSGNLFVADTYNHTIRFGQPGFLLRTALSDGQIVLSWPVAASNYVLETSGTLAPDAPWTPLSNGVVLLGDQFLQSNSISGPPAFFRLHLR